MEMCDDKYQYSLHINQRAAISLGIENANQAIIFECLTKATLWANPIDIDGQTYYWVHRKKTKEQLPLLSLKLDTVYRHYRRLGALGLIDYKKYKGMDCIRITQKAKKYFFGHKSETAKSSPNGDSEINPSNSKPAKLDVENAEINPNKHGNKSDILVNKNIRKTTTTQEGLIWPQLIPSNTHASIIKLARSRPLKEVQAAIDEVAGRIDAGEEIRSPVGYFNSLLKGMSAGTFVSAYALKTKGKRDKVLRGEKILAMNLEHSEKARLKMFERHKQTSQNKN